MEAEKLQSLFEKFCRLTSSCGDRKLEISALIEHLGNRLIMCPGSLNAEHRWSYAGGLIDQSMFVTRKMKALKTALEVNVSDESLLTVGLLHNIGMIGGPDDGQDYLIEQTSNWHRERGQLYTYGTTVPKMPIAHRSLQLLQHFGVKLSLEEWTAIVTSGGFARDENKFYLGTDHNLSILLMQARQWANCSE